MDDPTRRCENDTGNESHSPGPPIPSGGLFFARTYFLVGRHFCSSAKRLVDLACHGNRCLPQHMRDLRVAQP